MISNAAVRNLFRNSLLCSLFLFGTGSFAQQTQERPVKFDSGTISGLPARNIGSATMSGRVAAVTAFNDHGRLTVFAGSAGGGVYKSTDGGENWNNVGLKDTEHIAKILVSPKDSNTVWVCATGSAFADNQAGGVYKTTDGGQNWRKVLAGANPSTGCGMMSMAAQDPNTLYATTWYFRRQAWTFRSGGPGSGIFKSTDGGEHWNEINQST